MNEIHLKALAKVNLSLDVLGKREDGYHEVNMIMQNIRLFDKIGIEKTEETGFKLTSNLPYMPVNEDNLMVKAAKLMFDTFELPGGLCMDLFKCIPVAAGMAGGSSDAAAVIYGINRLFDLHLSLEKEMALGVKIGADVPYCLMRGTALSQGIGEKLTRLPACPKCWTVVAKPPISVSTKMVYEALDSTEITRHPDVDGMVEAIRAHDLYGMAALMGNVLEDVTIPKYPVIQTIKDSLMEKGAVNALMSGSGPTVFAIFDDLEKAKNAVYLLRKERTAAVVRIAEIG